MLDHVTRSLAARLRSDDGFTLIEVLVSITILVIGVFGTVATFEHSRKATTSSERIEAMAHLAQAAGEKILAQGYDKIGYSTTATLPAPSGSNNANDPLKYVQTGPKYPADWTSGTPSESFVSCATCSLTSNSSATDWQTTWNDGRFSGNVYRFVTWVADNCAGCANSNDYKRVTVVVSTTNFANTPFIYSTVVRNPA